MENREAGELATQAALDGLLEYWWALGLLYLVLLVALVLATRWIVRRRLAPREDGSPPQE